MVSILIAESDTNLYKELMILYINRMPSQINFERSFASNSLSEYWSEDNDVNPRDVYKSTKKKYKFDCPMCKHSFMKELGEISRPTKGGFCPYCTNRMLCDNNNCKKCNKNSFASDVRSKYWSNLNEVSARQVFKYSAKKFYFDCNVCKHIFLMSLVQISQGQFCQFCGCAQLCTDNDCNSCYEKSFASEPNSKYFSKLNKVDPRDLFKSSHKKYLFDCDICKHSYMSTLNTMTKIKRRVCPFCTNKLLCDDLKCNFCKEKSFESHTKKIYWSEKNKVKPRDVFKSTHEKYWFKCDICDHEFKISLNDVTTGKYCPYCANKKLCNNDCDSCKEKSLESSPMAKYWSIENNTEPRFVFKYARVKYKFDCPNCNKIYVAKPNSVSRGFWCGCTKNKTEKKLYDFLDDNYDSVIDAQKTFKWCRNKKLLPFDFYIADYKLIIELDGPQHFRQVSNWASPEQCQTSDKYKMDLANEHGYSIIRICQEDVYGDKNNWQRLLDYIKEYSKPRNIFIGDIYATDKFWSKLKHTQA